MIFVFVIISFFTIPLSSISIRAKMLNSLILQNLIKPSGVKNCKILYTRRKGLYNFGLSYFSYVALLFSDSQISTL